MMTWRLPSTVASPARPLDGVVPEQQVAREEDAGERRQPDGRARQRAVAPALRQRDERQHRQAVQARGRTSPSTGDTAAYL